MARAVAKRKETLPAVADETLFDDAGAGLADSMEDYALPFLRVAQALSPQLDKTEPNYIEGLEKGDIYDTVTSEMWSGEAGIIVVPVFSRTDWIVWRPNRGGFVGSHDRAAGQKMLSQCTQDERGQDILPDGNILQKTGTTYGVYVNPDTFECNPFIIAMASTQYKYWRRWNSMMQSIKLIRGNERVPAPAFAAAYQLTTMQEKNDQGSWYSWVPKLAGPYDGLCGKTDMSESDSILVNSNVVTTARDFFKTVQSGAAKVNFDQMADEPAADTINAAADEVM